MLRLEIPTELDDADICKWGDPELAMLAAGFIPARAELLGISEASVEAWLLAILKPEHHGLRARIMDHQREFLEVLFDFAREQEALLAELGPLEVPGG